jgi:hypothetical protein
MMNQDLPESLSSVLNSPPVTALRGIEVMRSTICRKARFAADMYVGVGCFVPVDRRILLLRH